MTNREVEERLSRRYGQEFAVISSKNVSDADALGLWWAKVFVVSPKDDPEVQFFAFNAVDGEVNNSVPGISNSLQDTYSLDISAEGIEEYILNEIDRKLTYDRSSVDFGISAMTILV